MALRAVNSTATATTQSSQIFDDRSAGGRRTMLYINNTSASLVTITFGDVTATASQGIILAQNQAFMMSTDAGAECWQRQVQAISAGTSVLAIVEMFEE